jgi:hypothetical protein
MRTRRHRSFLSRGLLLALVLSWTACFSEVKRKDASESTDDARGGDVSGTGGAGGSVGGPDGANATGGRTGVDAASGGNTGSGDGSAGTGGVSLDAPLGSGGIIPNGGSGGAAADVPLGGAGGAGGGGGSHDLPVEAPSLCQAAQDGTPCGDGMVCNQSQCVACAAGGTCPLSTPCHKGVYSCATGSPVCQDSGNAAEGADCGGGNVCRSGVCSACVGGQECPLPGQPCRKGILTCSAGVSSCVDNGAKPDLVACDDNNACTTGEACHSGLCNGGTTKTCTASDACHTAGTCDPTTGVCSNPKVATPKARDCTSSQDNDCDGIPDNTVDSVCQCKPGSSRDCDTHPGFDGKGPCKAGTQSCVLSADHSTSYYEATCTGAVAPAAKDSCATAGDDSNCNGTVNDGCSCTPANAATVCNDNKACTADSCSNGQCQNAVQSGYCLIAGTCYSNGTVDPNNPCRRCDASTSTTSWSNLASGQSCDDGLWCNGDADKCDGNGACTHTYPANNRCAGTTGACASTSCSESTKTCFQPTSFVCQTETVTGCLASTCDSDVMTWKVDHYCKGDRADCSGGQTVDRRSAATVAQNCSSSETCSSGQCVAALQCSSSVFCDSSAGLCWMTADTATDINQDDAKVYCNNLTLAGSSDWSLPTKTQFKTITRLGTCSSPPCPGHQGPGLDGCYWPIEMGRCDNQLWTSDSAFAWIVEEAFETMTIPSLTNYRIRCVVPGP